jgi:hypothetical protein
MPERWSVTPYKGEPATVVFPIVFLSSSRLRSRCATEHANPASCTTTNWFPPDARTPATGVIVLWTNVYVRIATKPYGPTHYLPGGRIDMTACLGPRASADDRSAVTAMLQSLHIRASYWY